MFEEHNGQEGCEPVCDDVEKVLHYFLKMISTSDGGDEENDATKKSPEEARNLHQVVANYLDIESEGVDIGDDYCDNGKG